MASDKDNIRKCDCISEYQDQKYGKWMRVHTPGKAKTPGVIIWCCSVCGRKK